MRGASKARGGAYSLDFSTQACRRNSKGETGNAACTDLLGCAVEIGADLVEFVVENATFF